MIDQLFEDNCYFGEWENSQKQVMTTLGIRINVRVLELMTRVGKSSVDHSRRMNHTLNCTNCQNKELL